MTRSELIQRYALDMLGRNVLRAQYHLPGNRHGRSGIGQYRRLVSDGYIITAADGTIADKVAASA